MRKFLSILSMMLALIFALSFSACSTGDSGDNDDGTNGDGKVYVETLNGKTPEQVYNTIQQASETATAVEMKTVQNITVSIDGEFGVITQNLLTRIDGDKQYGKSNSVMSFSGQDITISSLEFWFIDNTYYYDDGNSKLYFEIDLDEFTENLGMGGEDAVGDIPKDWFEDIKFEFVEEENVYKLAFNIKGDEYEQVFGKLGINGTNISDVKYEMVFSENGEMIDNVANFSIDMFVSGVSCRATVTQTSEIYFTLSEQITLPTNVSDFISIENPYA